MGDDKSKGLSLTPKMSFMLGLVGGVLVICTIGFFVVLSMLLGGDGISKKTSKTTTKPTAAAPAPSPSPSAVPRPPPAGDVPPVTDEDHVRGSGDVTIIEYSDYECPFCSRFHPSMKRLMDEYEGQVKWVYRHFPLSFHPEATPSANASECVAELGGNDVFWEYTDGLFGNQSALGDSLYKKLAVDLGVDGDDFEECMDERRHQAHITADQSGGSAAGVTGTPGSFIIAADGSATLVPGAIPYEQLEAMVLQVL